MHVHGLFSKIVAIEGLLLLLSDARVVISADSATRVVHAHDTTAPASIHLHELC